jgi:catechol 2,3-dioxygenase-like lactoylglutathione lyase family enzyme
VTSAYHHIGLEVGDIDAALAFYEDALDGHLLTRIRRVSTPFAGIVMGSGPATEFDQCRIGFDGGGCVELFQFVGADAPSWLTDAGGPRRLPHFGVLVDDVAESLKRVERAGGKALWPEIEEWGPAHTMYAADLDGNVFELCDAPSEKIVEILVDMYPECDPMTGEGKPRTVLADGR